MQSNVAGPRCGPRARRLNRHNHGFDHAAARLAVVVQEMVNADVAGVMSTANPLSAHVDEFVVNTSWGLGEAYGYIPNTRTDPVFVATRRREGKCADEIQALSDGYLKDYIEARMKIAADFNASLWDGFFRTAPFSFSLLGWIIENWYANKDDPAAFQNLLSGLPENWMIRESHNLWDLGSLIRESPTLRSAFEQHSGSDFPHSVADHADGEAFRAALKAFMLNYGHRGHADRDMYYKRRVEDIGLLYDALRSIVASDESKSPYTLEQQRIADRKATTGTIIDHLMQQPLGGLKAKAFTWTLGYVHRFLTLREDERWCFDPLTMAKKRAFEELGQRLVQRGLLEGERDFYFLSKHELFEVFDGVGPTRLTMAKIAAAPQPRRASYATWRTSARSKRATSWFAMQPIQAERRFSYSSRASSSRPVASSVTARACRANTDCPRLHLKMP